MLGPASGDYKTPPVILSHLTTTPKAYALVAALSTKPVRFDDSEKDSTMAFATESVVKELSDSAQGLYVETVRPAPLSLILRYTDLHYHFARRFSMVSVYHPFRGASCETITHSRSERSFEQTCSSANKTTMA